MSKQLINVMVDLETLSTQANAGILAIGATVFKTNFDDRAGNYTYYQKASMASCEAAGMHISKATLDWWGKQQVAARMEAFSGTLDIKKVLEEFAYFLMTIKSDTKQDIALWGNGADFDNSILADAYDRFGMELPWKYTNNRCFRTLKNVFSFVKPDDFVGVKHNALSDAKNQAAHAEKIFRHLVFSGVI